MNDERNNSDEPNPKGWVSRRGFLGMTAAGGAAVAASGLFAGSADAATPQHWPCGPRGTTLEHTLLPGTPGAGGYAPLVVRPGEPHLLRDELVGSLRHRHGRRRPITVLGQLTDVHIMDAQSPARVEYLDRYNDPGSPFASLLPFDSSYRAHEMLSAQVSDSMVRAMNRVGRGPVTGRRIDFTIATGDNVDNTQHNELRWQIDLLDGETIRPDSGDLTKYEGVADLTHYDRHYWHPDGAPSGRPADRPHTKWGFPSVPGLLDACRKPFRAAGLRTPWLTTFGNHDGLVQGNLPDIPQASQLAVGRVKFIDLPASLTTDPAAFLQWAQDLAQLKPDALQQLFSGPYRLVTPDPDRRPLSRLETIQEHFNTSGFPKGHGYTQANVSSGNAYYTFDRGIVRGLVLDTVNPFGGSEGSMDEAQFAWLTAQLQAGSRRYLDDAGHWVRGGGRDRLFVIFSHHTIETMTNASTPPGVDRILGHAGGSVVAALPERRAVGERAHAPQHRGALRACRRDAARRLLGGQHRGAHRLAAAGAHRRDRRQRQRDAVDLRHDHRPCRAGQARPDARRRDDGEPVARTVVQRLAAPDTDRDRRWPPRCARGPQRRTARPHALRPGLGAAQITR